MQGLRGQGIAGIQRLKEVAEKVSWHAQNDDRG